MSVLVLQLLQGLKVTIKFGKISENKSQKVTEIPRAASMFEAQMRHLVTQRNKVDTTRIHPNPHDRTNSKYLWMVVFSAS